MLYFLSFWKRRLNIRIEGTRSKDYPALHQKDDAETAAAVAFSGEASTNGKLGGTDE
jgi:hypothetical protein